MIKKLEGDITLTDVDVCALGNSPDIIDQKSEPTLATNTAVVESKLQGD